MRRARPLLAWLLVAVWLPVTAHCEFERAGLLPPALEACCPDDSAEDAQGEEPCADDPCAVVESGFTKAMAAKVTVLPPALVPCLYAIVPDEPDDETAPVSPRVDDSSWARPNTWQFVRRAALPARAPDCVA